MSSIIENIGQNVDKAIYVSDVLKMAKLDFVVKPESCYYMYDGQPVLVPGVVANVREDTGAILGVVSNRYRILQNEDAFDFVNYISEDITFRKAGMTSNGIIYIIAELQSSMFLNEEYKNYIIFRNAHNGKFPLQATISPMRVVCENQFNVIFSHSENRIYIKHLPGFEQKLQMAKQVLMGYTHTIRKLESRINEFATLKFTKEQFSLFVEDVFPITNEMSVSIAYNQEEKRNVLNYAYNVDNNQNFKGTLLGAINATTYYDSHKYEIFHESSNNYEKNFFKLIDENQLTNKLLDFALA